MDLANKKKVHSEQNVKILNRDDLYHSFPFLCQTPT